MTARPPAAGWNGQVTWQARGLWPPAGESAVVAGPRLIESDRGRVYGWPGPGPARLSHPAGTVGLATYYGVGVTLCLKRHGHVRRRLCLFLYAYQAFQFLLD